MTTTNQGTARRPGQPAPDLVLFLVFHAGLRRDFKRLADAYDRCDPGDARRLAPIDEHTALLLRALHHHHTSEDEEIWPMLRTLAPEAGEVLDRLEADHQDMDAVIERLTSGRLTTREKADDLRRLHELLSGHLDLEEAHAVPVIRERVSAEWWEEVGERVSKSQGRDLPMIAAWLMDVAGPAERQHILDTAPMIMRVLYRLSWRRAYERRAAQIFG
ncbi:hemerythrin domain-containing protein [Thermopolyspora sp. NPDC052614]|uniref:hemerythrin domain-containing protein n=1 Tax=Thermopolyspora sp. NPDC052614 TaxID=3155682 RepID=UPI00342955A1